MATTAKTTKSKTVKRNGRSFTPKTAEQKEAERTEAHGRLVEAVENLTTESGWDNFLRAGRFMATRYSLNNMLLILAQRPDATIVGAFKFWIDKGRSPIKGEGIKIIGFAKTEELNPVTGELEETKRFPMITVWDVQNTRVIDEEKWAKASAKIGNVGTVKRPTSAGATLLTGDDETGIGDAVAEYMRGNGWNVVDEKIRGGANGYTRPADKKVAVRNDVSPAQRAKTLIHEAAHIECDHIADMTEYAMHRGRMECEAEGTAYVVGDALGLDTSGYSVGYLTGWAKGDMAMVRETAATVLKAAKGILTGIGEDGDDTDGE